MIILCNHPEATELDASSHLAPLPIAQRALSPDLPTSEYHQTSAQVIIVLNAGIDGHLNSNPEIWQITLSLPFPNCLLWRLPAVVVRVYFKATSFISLMANWCSNRASNSCHCSKQGRNLVVNIDGTSNQYGPKVNQILRWLYLFVWAILEHEHYWDF